MALPDIKFRTFIEVSYNGGRSVELPPPGSVKETGEDQAIYYRGRRGKRGHLEWFGTEGHISLGTNRLFFSTNDNEATRMILCGNINEGGIGVLKFKYPKQVRLPVSEDHLDTGFGFSPEVVDVDCVVLLDGRVFGKADSPEEQVTLVKSLNIPVAKQQSQEVSLSTP